jgi:MFS superfamily sulfate permease-like transporter
MAVSIGSAQLPILAQLRGYRREWLRSDCAAGLSVAAVSLPSTASEADVASITRLT